LSPKGSFQLHCRRNPVGRVFYSKSYIKRHLFGFALPAIIVISNNAKLSTQCLESNSLTPIQPPHDTLAFVTFFYYAKLLCQK
jgi:hypothetical protein